MLKKIIYGLIILTLFAFSCGKMAGKYFWDLSQNKLNTISSSTKELLQDLDAPLQIAVYSPKMDLLNMCNELLSQYSHASSNVEVALRQTLLDPSLASKLKVYTENNIVVTYQGRQKALDLKIANLNEQSISNLILQVSAEPNQWVAYLSGHQEIDPYDTSIMGLSGLTKLIKERGLHIAQLNLAEQHLIPDNTNTIIIANPQFALMPLEKTLLQEYIQHGGKIIWFTEPDSPVADFIKTEFGLQLAPGVIIDPASLKLGSPHPALKVITEYPQHAINQDIKTATIMPWSGHLYKTKAIKDWQYENIITTGAQTWTYSGSATEDLNVLSQHQDHKGPLNIGFALSRKMDNHEQRILVIADSSFIINKYITLYANSQLVSNLLGWIQETKPILICSTATARDLSYNPNTFNLFLLRYGFTILLPLLLIVVGFRLQR